MSDYYVSANDPATAKSIAEKFGFCLVRGVFSPEEMASLERDLATAYVEFGGEGAVLPDLYMLPSLQWLLLDPRIQRFARALLGEQLVYYRETAANYENTPGPITQNTFREYHCDARGTRADLFGAPADGQIYPSYRFAIYFRNYRDHSGGLKVAPGSHLRPYLYDRIYQVSDVVKKLPAVEHIIGNGVLTIPAAPMELYNVSDGALQCALRTRRSGHLQLAHVSFGGRATFPGPADAGDLAVRREKIDGPGRTTSRAHPVRPPQFDFLRFCPAHRAYGFLRQVARAQHG
jgi:hypothetical protein